ncbi:hypothetical protein BDY17DRAFT_195437 [Neohortaea acidophila]|uniref:F-box domain-containing protein n=1 Tax=Neohortaea acidophila TaxID=245834 RepID=A0A6A6PL04_9PEZI|nr:uncharacterized protein BDY17DRAFT_195437 [Neohortaea acidophila]KAF2480605.1 hypothetical protein BDY17DRAFT_195437 [Neohortaea acidophila]
MSIDICPSEIIESIVELLEKDDVLNLRLCNRALAALAAGDTFRSYFDTYTLHLNLEAVRSFIRFTECQTLAPFLKNLVLVGEIVDTHFLDDVIRRKGYTEYTPYGTRRSILHPCTPAELEVLKKTQDALHALEKEQHERDHALTWPRVTLNWTDSMSKVLAEAFESLKKYRKSYALSLELALLRRDAIRGERPLPRSREEDPWDQETAPEIASKILHICIASLAQSRLPVHSLNAFYGLPYCHSPCRDLHDIAKHEEGLRAAFKSLSSLSISLCARILSENESYEVEEDEDPGFAKKTLLNDEGNFAGFPVFLSFMPLLESLRIHWYTVERSQPRRFLDHLSASAYNLPLLRSCTLDGVCFRQATLSTFLHNFPIKRLTMVGVQLIHSRNHGWPSMTWADTFKDLTREDSSLEYLFLDELYHSNALIFFNETSAADRTYPCEIMEDGVGANTLVRCGMEQIRGLPIEYTVPRTRRTVKHACSEWYQNRWQKYGYEQS